MKPEELTDSEREQIERKGIDKFLADEEKSTSRQIDRRKCVSLLGKGLATATGGYALSQAGIKIPGNAFGVDDAEAISFLRGHIFFFILSVLIIHEKIFDFDLTNKKITLKGNIGSHYPKIVTFHENKIVFEGNRGTALPSKGIRLDKNSFKFSGTRGFRIPTKIKFYENQILFEGNNGSNHPIYFEEKGNTLILVGHRGARNPTHLEIKDNKTFYKGNMGSNLPKFCIKTKSSYKFHGRRGSFLPKELQIESI